MKLAVLIFSLICFGVSLVPDELGDSIGVGFANTLSGVRGVIVDGGVTGGVTIAGGGEGVGSRVPESRRSTCCPSFHTAPCKYNAALRSRDTPPAKKNQMDDDL